MAPLVSIVIPAFNKPDLLIKAVESVFLQTYRPIQLVIVDDNSPINLSSSLENFLSDDSINVEYYRNPRNLKPYWNMHHARKYAKGQYLIFLPHDDYFVDENFISDSVQFIGKNPSCNVVIANSLAEDTSKTMMAISFNQYLIYDGNKFLCKELWKNLHPSYSGVLLNYDFILEKGYDNFMLDEGICKNMRIEPDEFFLGIVLAAEDSKVGISGKVVSVRGNPEDSYSKTDYWQKKGAESCFIPQYQMYKYFLDRFKKKEALVFAKNIIFFFPTNSLNLKILEFLEYQRDAIILMMLSRCYSAIRNIPISLLRACRQILTWTGRTISPLLR